jgi:beta-galactosidase
MNIRFGGRKASRIYFLHTGAFGEEGGEYRVHYSKSTEHVETIPLTSSRIGNWWSPSDLPEAPIAWSGTNGANRVGLYRYAWKNPRPDVVIDSIDFISDGQGPILGLFAMTGQE